MITRRSLPSTRTPAKDWESRYVRSTERPEAAEVAVTVIDDWQGRGLGTLLLEVLSAQAREEGIDSFTAPMLATNEEMMDMLKRLDPVRILDREVGTDQIEVPIPAIGLAPPLRELLRISARSDVVVPPSLATGRDALSGVAQGVDPADDAHR